MSSGPPVSVQAATTGSCFLFKNKKLFLHLNIYSFFPIKGEIYGYICGGGTGETRQNVIGHTRVVVVVVGGVRVSVAV